MTKVIKKRDGSFVDYDENKVINAIRKAMIETKAGVDLELAKRIADELFLDTNVTNVEEEQDAIEDKLYLYGRGDVGKKYIIYRFEKEKLRGKHTHPYKLLSKEFLSKYKHIDPPMTQLGEAVYFRTYSRYIHELDRREYWWETVARSVDYNCSLIKTTKEEAEELFDNIFNLRQFLSGK